MFLDVLVWCRMRLSHSLANLSSLSLYTLYLVYFSHNIPPPCCAPKYRWLESFESTNSEVYTFNTTYKYYHCCSTRYICYLLSTSTLLLLNVAGRVTPLGLRGAQRPKHRLLWCDRPSRSYIEQRERPACSIHGYDRMMSLGPVPCDSLHIVNSGHQFASSPNLAVSRRCCSDHRFFYRRLFALMS